MELLYYNEKQGWQTGETLFQALDIEGRLRQKRPQVISLVGGGGKTSYIRQLALEGRRLGLDVLVTTTTHMAVSHEFGVFEPDEAQVASALKRDGLVVAGKLEKNGKIAFWDWETYEKLGQTADLVLVEADGSKRLPMKVPAGNEPVIPENTDVLLCLFGLSALGRPGGDVCFRLERAASILGFSAKEQVDSWSVSRADMGRLMLEGYLKPLRRQFPAMDILPVFHQADNRELQRQGQALLADMGEKRGILSGGLQLEPSASLF